MGVYGKQAIITGNSAGIIHFFRIGERVRAIRTRPGSQGRLIFDMKNSEGKEQSLYKGDFEWAEDMLRSSFDRALAPHDGALRNMAENNAALLDEYVQAADRLRHGDFNPSGYEETVQELREEIIRRMNR